MCHGAPAASAALSGRAGLWGLVVRARRDVLGRVFASSFWPAAVGGCRMPAFPGDGRNARSPPLLPLHVPGRLHPRSASKQAGVAGSGIISKPGPPEPPRTSSWMSPLSGIPLLSRLVFIFSQVAEGSRFLHECFPAVLPCGVLLGSEHPSMWTSPLSKLGFLPLPRGQVGSTQGSPHPLLSLSHPSC